MNEALNSGRATLSRRPDGIPIIGAASITKHSTTPMAWMTPEEAEFQLRLRRINAGIQTKQRRFQSLLDNEANIYFRYCIEDHAETESRRQLLDSIHNVIENIHSGKAVRVEMNNGTVRLGPSRHQPDKRDAKTR